MKVYLTTLGWPENQIALQFTNYRSV